MPEMPAITVQTRVLGHRRLKCLHSRYVWSIEDARDIDDSAESARNGAGSRIRFELPDNRETYSSGFRNRSVNGFLRQTVKPFRPNA